MDFTREPIIETIITPKEGSKLAVRNSKSGQEEFFVDAVELVCFGHSLFFRSSEKPKPFLVPVGDYEVLEVKEARLVLKHANPERVIKIGGGREPIIKSGKEAEKPQERTEQESTSAASSSEGGTDTVENQLERRRDRRRPVRKRKQREDEIKKEDNNDISVNEAQETNSEAVESVTPPSNRHVGQPQQQQTNIVKTPLLPPPPLLISETIAKYRQDNSFKGAFFLTEEEYAPHSKVNELLGDEEPELPLPPIPQPEHLEPAEDSSDASHFLFNDLNDPKDPNEESDQESSEKNKKEDDLPF